MSDAVTGAVSQPSQPLTAVQKAALSRLDQAATQLEGVFLEMMMNEMNKTVSHDTIFGKESMGEQIFSSMLDDQRAQQLAQSGSFGLATEIENQLRPAVLANAQSEARVRVDGKAAP